MTPPPADNQGLPFRVVNLREVGSGAVLAAINEAFGRALTPEWYSWKHKDGPWGPSRGWIAVDSTGIVGTRLFVPWRLHSSSGEHDCARALDGATVPRARRKGIFTALVRAEMASLAGAPRWSCLYSTSVPASREAYRASGWTILPQTTVHYRPVVPARPSSIVLDEDPQCDPGPPDGRLRTAWTSVGLRWRADPRSGQAYSTARLRAANGPNGLLFRVFSARGVRVLAVVHAWGAADEQRQLVRAVAGAVRAPLLHEPDGPATSPVGSGLGLRRPGSTVSLWCNDIQRAAPEQDPHTPTAWAFDSADLEGVL